MLTRILGRLARYAQPIVLLDAALLLGGVLLTSMNLLLLGWSVYVLGHVLAIVAFVAIGAYYRERMDGWAWTGLLVVLAGLVLGLPQAGTILSSYIHTPTGALMQLPSQTAPLGPFAELVLWIGIAVYGLAARGAKALPTLVGWIFLVAAVLGLLAAFVDVWIVTPYWWVLAMLTLVIALVGVGGSVGSSSANMSLASTPESAV